MTLALAPERLKVVQLHLLSRIALLAASLVGLAGFGWPFFVTPSGAEGGGSHASDAPWLFVLLLVLVFAVVLAEIADGGLDAKAIAVLGVLAACGAALRPVSAGVTGFSLAFFLLIPAGRVFGAGFGFVLGAVTLFASALVTGGVGPWLPFQMLGAGWIGLFAGMLPPARGKAELALLAAYGALAGLAYGALLNLWFWPFTISGTGATTLLAYLPGAEPVENLARYARFYAVTSLGFDIPRAIGNVALVLVAGRPVLGALRRCARQAAFGAVPEFGAAAAGPPPSRVRTGR